jgi:hypothetical protein
MAALTSGDVLLECWAGIPGTRLVTDDGEMLVTTKKISIDSGMAAKIGQDSRFDRARFEAIVSSGGYQRPMGGLYRVGETGAREDPAVGCSIETL